jgi:hypothetical protein
MADTDLASAGDSIQGPENVDSAQCRHRWRVAPHAGDEQVVIASDRLARDDLVGGVAMKVRPGAVIRGSGVAIACLAPDRSKRSSLLVAGFAGGWFLDRPGLQIFTVIPDGDELWKRTTVPFATSVTAWSTVMLAATTAARRTRLPAPIAAVVLGGAFIAIDSLLADLGEAREAREASAAAESAEPEAAGP